MSVALLGWVLSSTGAALFFAAGNLWAARRHRARVGRVVTYADELVRTRAERDRLQGALSELERGALAEAQRERDKLRTDLSKTQRVARDAALRAKQHRLEVDELLGELRAKPRLRKSSGPMVVDVGVRGDVLRGILDRETSGNGFTGAVIADELGLIVASTGEYGDALAAYGAYLAGVGAKTRSVLPLHELRQLVIQDDHDTTLTVRPISSAEDHLALVTLAPGRPSGEHVVSNERSS